MVIASKSPLTGGYGDGNIGTMASVHLRKAGYDVLVVEGKSDKPCYLLIEDDSVRIMDASAYGAKIRLRPRTSLKRNTERIQGFLSLAPAVRIWSDLQP